MLQTIQYIEGETAEKKAFCLSLNLDGDKYSVQTQLGCRLFKTIAQSDNIVFAISKYNEAVKRRQKSKCVFRGSGNLLSASSFGLWLYTERGVRRLTVQMFSDMTGIPEASIEQLQSGILNDIKEWHVQKIAKAFGLTEEEVLSYINTSFLQTLKEQEVHSYINTSLLQLKGQEALAGGN